MVSASSVDKFFRNVDEDVQNMGKATALFEKKGDVSFVKYVLEFYHERQKLLELMRPLKNQSKPDEQKMRLAERRAYEQLEQIMNKIRFSLDALAKQLEISFESFIRVFNLHVSYVHDYPGFQTLYNFIANRLRLFLSIDRALHRPSYSQFMNPQDLARIEDILRGLHDKYVYLDNSLKTLDKLFVEFNNELNLLYRKTAELEILRPFYRKQGTGFWGVLTGKKPQFTFDRQKAIDFLKSRRIVLSASDASRMAAIRKLADIMHNRTVSIIRARKEDVREKLVDIAASEIELRKTMIKSYKQVKKSFKYQKKAA